MGNGSSASNKARYDRARVSGVLTLDNSNISSWSKLIESLKRAEGIRSASLSRNKLVKPVPSSFLRLSWWTSLRSLDLSGNGLTDVSALGGLRAYDERGSNTKHVAERISAVPFPPHPDDPSLKRITSHPLEALNLSHNALTALPPLLCYVFPQLTSLKCTDNAGELQIPCGAARFLGNSASLQLLDLTKSGLSEFSVLDGPLPERTRVLPALRELLLGGNKLSGVFSLAPAADARLLLLPKLKRIDISHNTASFSSIDPNVYVSAPLLGQLDMTGLAEEKKLFEQLSQTEVFQEWRANYKGVVDKKLANGGAAELI